MRKTRELSAILALTLIALGAVSQSVSATAFFDSRLTLIAKADPTLRSYLQDNSGDELRRVNVLLVFSVTPSTGELSLLSSLCTVHTFTGHVATVNIPVFLLPKLASMPFVTRITRPRMLKPSLDVSVPEILADRVWNTTRYEGLRDAYGKTIDGTGVIIGVADSGIDYLHKDFDYKNGTSKILYIWDQTATGASPNGYDYGKECAPVDIQSGSCGESDGGTSLETGHGTAVAAVAASSGQASQNYYGVAPGASIIAVKLVDGSENYVIDALGYMIAKSHQLNRPLVIVHSLGSPLGSHDGTEPLELAFTDFASQGVPIVVAAGNDRNANLHVSGTLSPGESVNVRFSTTQNQNFVDIWYPSSNVLDISLTTPSGQIITGQTPDFGVSTPNGNAIVLSDMRASGREWWINITTPGQASSGGWSFNLTSISGPQGRWDAWTDPGQFFPGTGTSSQLYSIDSSDTIDAPGTAVGVITVGAYITKYWWAGRCTNCLRWNANKGVHGIWWDPKFAPGPDESLQCPDSCPPYYSQGVGDLSYSSGSGPTRDGRMKPEITAPGGNIAAARASTIPGCDSSNLQIQHSCSDPDNYHEVWRGTSFAAPHVAGVIALMLQMNPYLSPNEIKIILEADGRQDNYTGIIDKATGSSSWGWGKVDALHSTINAPTLYSVRINVQSVGEPLVAELNLDGAAVGQIPLNETKTVTLEFKSGGTHRIELTPILSVQPGTRYVLQDFSWTFSSGGTKTFTYELQHYLQVNSPYGYASGTGWYKANSTATASVTPTTVDGHDFQGWIGSVASNSPSVTLSMDSSKQMTATWSQGLAVGGQNGNNLVFAAGIMILVASVVLVAFMKRRSLALRLRQHPSGDLPPHPS